MSGKTAERARPDVRNPSDAASPHPFDDWLRRELKARLADPDDQPLPPDLVDLIDKLEERLAATDRRRDTTEPD